MPYVAVNKNSKEEITKLVSLIAKKFNLKVGDQLPDQRGAAEILGISRQRYREAISCLAFTGYVETYQGKPSIVVKCLSDFE